MKHVSLQHSSPKSEAQAIYLGDLGAPSLRRRVPGCWGEYWGWVSTLWSREKVVTSPHCQPALPTGQGSSRACFKSWPSTGMLHELMTARQLEYGDCHLCYWYIFICILSLMLLLSLIHLNKSAAIIYSYLPRETFIFSELRCALYLAQQFCSELLPAQWQQSYMHSISHPNCSSLLQFLLLFSLYLMLFNFSALSFPSVSAVRVCWRGDGLNPRPCSLFPEPFREPSANLSDHLAALSQTTSLSQRLELIQDLGRYWRV